MKPNKYTLLLLILLCRLSPAQGVTCSSPEVLNALNKSVHTASLMRNTELQPQYILDVPVSFSHFSDSVARDGWLTCWAHSSLAIDKNIGNLLTSEDIKHSEKANEIATEHLPNIYANAVEENKKVLTIKGFHYNVYMTSTGDLKNIELDGNDPVTHAIYGIAWFKQNLDKVKDEIAHNAYIDAYSDFTSKDRYINEIYNGFPIIIQKKLKNDMRRWIKEKNDRCGKVESLIDKSITITEKTAVYKCQAEMTERQIEVLTR